MLFSVFLLTGCPTTPDPKPTDNPVSKGIIYYFISAPINLDKANEASEILDEISGYNNSEARLVFSENIYRVIELCPKKKFMVPNGAIQTNDFESAKQLMQSSSDSLSEKEKRCSPSFEESIDVATNLTDAARKEKNSIVILWQIPWHVDQAPKELRDKLKEQVDILAQADNVKSVIVFGVNPVDADKIASSFQALQKKEKFAISTNSFQTLEQIKALRQNLSKK